MEFSISAEELAKALYRSHGIAERKMTIPILANVLIRAEEGKVSFTAFDLDIGLISEHPAEVTEPGAITISCKHLFEIARTLPEAKVTLKTTANCGVQILCGSSKIRLLGMPASEYPALLREEGANLIKIDGSALLGMISKTAFSISTDETRYILNGLYFESLPEKKVRVVSTDGHRLSMIEKTMPEDFNLAKGATIPRKGVLELKRLLEEAPDAECFLGFGPTSVQFKKPGLSMIVRLLDGQFPEYNDVIPKEQEQPLKLSRRSLAETLKRIALLSEEKSHTVRFKLTGGALHVSSQNPDLGDANENIALDYQGGDVEVGFNARYIIEILGAIETEEVTLQITDEQSPGVLRPLNDSSYTAVVMPIRI